MTLPGGGGSVGTGGAPVEFVYRDANDCNSGAEQIPGVICRDDMSVTFAGTDIPWQPITLQDIAGFVPASTELEPEPGGWGIRGLPTNFVSTAKTHEVAGRLLGQPADVRFTPVRWDWAYGDGQTRTTTTGGATWSALGVDRFDPTPTSHTYSQRGTVDVAVTVHYRAEYRFSGSVWGTVQGTLAAASPAQPLLVVTESTVLVDRPCSSPAASSC